MKRSPISRKGSLRPVSKKRQAQTGDRARTRHVVLARAGGVCEARIDGCDSTATDVHEIKTRARGGSITDSENCLALCRPCHSYITDHPAFSETHGFIIPSWAGEIEMTYAARARLSYRWRD